MDKNKKITKQVFDIISKLKRVVIHSNSENNTDIRPSEEMFLVKIDALANNDYVKVSDLVSILKFAPSTVSTILKSLEDNDFIVREINKNNRREVFVKITNKGKNRLEKAKKRHFDTINSLITYLGEDDAFKLIEILERTLCFFEKNNELKGENNNDKIN